MEVTDEHKELLDRFPFLSLCKHGGGEYVGIVQNQSNTVCSVYVYSKLNNLTITNKDQVGVQSIYISINYRNFLGNI